MTNMEGVKHGAETIGTEALMLVNEIGPRETVGVLLSAAGVIAANTGLDADDFLELVDKLRDMVVKGNPDAAA